MNATILRLPDLSDADAAAWRSFQASDPALASPYFSLDYLGVLETVYPGIRVLKLGPADAPAGFLPYRSDMLGTARPADGFLGDLHGVIAMPGTRLDMTSALKAAGIGGYAFSALPYQQVRHGFRGSNGDGNQVVDLSQGYEAYLQERYNYNSSFRRTHRKVLAFLDNPALSVEHDTFDVKAFRRLIELKQQGYGRAGHFDIFQLGWPEHLLHQLAQNDCGEVKGVLSVMRLEGELVAACFCMRSASVLHYWFPGYEDRFADQKPGHAMLFSLLDWAGAQGIKEVHLGLGNVQYKRQMASFAAPVRQGTLAIALPQKALAGFHAWSARWEAEGRGAGAFSARVARKIERVAMSGKLSA
ncbi:GNAT family N-acetyltransferase [Henriciella sp.]|uniref:GNAT family N-acetyltransferase n=1 Tax=Henriciella sp. TaxID=1968823 RepID=UPI002632B831|nr:GNAT family N-acetyltransferase [Henriciella sp.]